MADVVILAYRPIGKDCFINRYGPHLARFFLYKILHKGFVHIGRSLIFKIAGKSINLKLIQTDGKGELSVQSDNLSPFSCKSTVYRLFIYKIMQKFFGCREVNVVIPTLCSTVYPPGRLREHT